MGGYVSQDKHNESCLNQKGYSTCSLIFSGNGSHYEIRDGDKKEPVLLYRYNLSDETVVTCVEDNSNFIILNKDGEVLDNMRRKLGKVTINRLMPGNISGNLCFVFKSTEEDITLVSIDRQKLCQCDIPIYGKNALEWTSFSDAKGTDLKAYAVDGPSGVKLSFSEYNSDLKKSLFALLIMRNLFHSKMIQRSIIMNGIN